MVIFGLKCAGNRHDNPPWAVFDLGNCHRTSVKCGGRVAAQHFWVAFVTIAKDEEEDALELLPVNHVDDKVHRAVERHHQVGDLREGRDGD